MDYKTMPNGTERLSILGFGMMRLPTAEDGKIDQQQAIKMVRYGIDNGITYIDTAWPYHQGESEAFTAKVLRDGYRGKVQLATKLPIWLVRRHEDFEHYLSKQLQRLETDQIDFYLLHAIGQKRWKENLLANDVFRFLDRIKADGRVKHVGFSFHDNLELFKEVVDSYDWDFCQIQLNFIDENYQAGIEGMRYAHKKGLGIIVMEPLRGGSLVTDIPEGIQAIWKTGNPERTPVEWALKYVWQYPEVTLLLSGMGTLEQVKENIRSASRADVHALTPGEKEVIEKVKLAYRSRIQVPCTTCKYCMPCPHGVDIPAAFKMFNDASLFEKPEHYRQRYLNNIPQENRASRCVACGACLEKCPQHIEIIRELERVGSAFENE